MLGCCGLHCASLRLQSAGESVYKPVIQAGVLGPATACRGLSKLGWRETGSRSNSIFRAPPDGMCAVQQALYETVRKRDPAQSEFLQAVEEACAPHLSKHCSARLHKTA